MNQDENSTIGTYTGQKNLRNGSSQTRTNQTSDSFSSPRKAIGRNFSFGSTISPRNTICRNHSSGSTSSPRKAIGRNHSSGSTGSPRKAIGRNHSSGSTGSPRKYLRRNHSSGSSGSSSSVSSITTFDTFNTSGLSVVKTLTLLRSQPANRSCADCRAALIDPSSIYVSLCIAKPICKKVNDQKHPRSSRKIALQDFRLTHSAFAPPNNTSTPAFEVVSSDSNECDKIFCCSGSKSSQNNYDDDLAFSANQRFGGHGVFICGRCAEAHRELGPPIEVKRVTDSSLWTMEEAHFIVNNGGNAQCWRIYEAFVPDRWKGRRPIYASSLSARILFCRAKYEALAFCLPPPGPNAKKAWEKILQKQQDQNKMASGSSNLKNISSLSLSNHSRKNADIGFSNKTKKDGLPNRLIDYFCVISSSMQLLPSKSGKKKKQRKLRYSSISSPEALDFWPHVTDCYPTPNTHGEMGYLDHISSFVMPGGCHPTLDPKPPAFSTFVLTMADGSFLYGGSLQIYDEHVDAEEVKSAMRESGYEGEFPHFLMHDGQTKNDSDVFFFPKCLVFLSRYAFFDLFRSVLLEIYQISLIAAPLPIERYVSNFVSEIPLPPQGQVKVEFSFTTDRKFGIERPAINKLPMTNFSYRPLFACLSVSNILVALGYLLQECKVVLLSKHYSLLTPVAEALLSAMFPFRWVGLYIPVAPLKMMDVLDAPIPYLIGLSSEYLNTVEVRHRPKDAIFVDLDRDIIHIGDISLPKIPDHDAQKLATSLEAAGGSVYVLPSGGLKGCIMAGSRKADLVENANRPRYAQMTDMSGIEVNSSSRDEMFSICDLAYGRSDDEAGRIRGFGCIDGQLTSMEETKTNEKKKSKNPIKLSKIGRNKKTEILSRSQSAMRQVHLLDMTEPDGFSVVNIRNAFLRFTVATFADYQDSLIENSGRDLFDEEKFAEDVGSHGRSMIFLKNVLGSQLFRRFLEERKENPDIPEIRFFDESIIAKRNRSKRETFAKGGKRRTPFLDDTTTWEIKKVFTPPPPNNLGLPDSEAYYRYGIFPVLDVARFGRIRPPMTWRQHACLDSVMYTKKFDSNMKKSQNEIVKNALKSVFATPNAIAAAAKRSARDLESTLSALSIVTAVKHQGMSNVSPAELKLPSSLTNIKTLSTADTIMMDARRKQSILLDYIIRIQALFRGFLARDYYAKNKFEILELRRSKEQAVLALRRNQEQAERESQLRIQKLLEEKRFQLRIRKLIKIQKYVRMCLALRKYKRVRKLIKIQKCVRMCLALKKYRRVCRAIITIQTNQRSSSRQKRFRLLKDSTIIIAKYMKARRAQLIFRELRRMIVTIQSRVRGGLLRSKVKLIMEQKMDLYSTQIFVLWTRLHVPLMLRAKFWPNISEGKSFLRLHLAESELVRLWDIACLTDCWNSGKSSDKISLCGDSIGMSNDIYYKSRQCANWIQNGETISSKHSNALKLEETERLQIYERLTSSVTESVISELYRNFDIAPDEKLKKVALSGKIWKESDLVDRSVASMNTIFPELKNSLGINYLKPTSKGQRRFPNALKLPVPPIDHVLWEDISIEGKTKRHVQEVAMLFITKVPELSKQMNSLVTSRDDNFDSLLRAVMKVQGFQNVEQTRVCIIWDYINGTDRSCDRN